jgi:hypothetical protein
MILNAYLRTGRDVRQDVVDRLRQLAHSDPDDSVRRAAQRCLRELWATARGGGSVRTERYGHEQEWSQTTHANETCAQATPGGGAVGGHGRSYGRAECRILLSILFSRSGAKWSDRQGYDLAKAVLGARDRDAATRIKRARSAEEVIDLVPLATGLGQSIWQERVRQFGPEAVPLISQRLAVLHETREKELRHVMLEKLIGALRWQGDAGASALLERFDGLDDYGRCLACVVLGLLGKRSAADKLWHFYQRVVGKRRERHFVGALWGLIDLGDERAGEALADLVGQKRAFYELYGFLSLAADARVIVPLLSNVAQESRENEQAAMALVSIANRVGRDAFAVELGKMVTPEESAQERKAFAERFFSVPESRAREYFGRF